ncbi:Pyruvate dehydrogenase E1 component subunit beta-3, chloroplastic [Ancistrocladus abbreviatus]
MAAALHSLAAASSLSSPGSFDSKKFQVPCGKLIAERTQSILIDISELRAASGSKLKGRIVVNLVANAVATKADGSVASTASKPGHEVLLFEALQEGLDEEMQRDPCVCVMGEDVGHYGGSYKVTKGLATKYGDLRVLDTPIAEKPVIEGMNMGFLLLAFNQISNHCGMVHYTSGGQFTIPVVIRGPGGVGRQLGAEHS